MCNIHPLMMFQRQAKKVFQIIHDAFGKAKIKDCFLVDIDFHDESFIIKAVTCLSSFINKDYSSKPWNRNSHFGHYISPKENQSLSFKDHRFNRMFDCCAAILYHLEDIKAYLEHFQNIVNGISILNRGFLDMDILKPILCATVLMGIHITGPLLQVLKNPNTKHSHLTKLFQTLYTDLLETNAVTFLQTKKVATSFVSQEFFLECLPKDCIIACVDTYIVEFKDYIAQLVKLFLKEFAEGLAIQKGAIFGFGPQSENDTGTLLKLSSVNNFEKLDNVAIHNLGEERSVGYINFELGNRSSNLQCASNQMVLNKGKDLICPKDLYKFKKPAQSIKQIKLQWNEKMKAMEARGFSQKEALNLKEETRKLADLEFLKNQTPTGPFTSSEEVSSYLLNDEIDEDSKNHRLYIEIRYARKTSLSLKPTASVFRLKKNYSNLSS